MERDEERAFLERLIRDFESATGRRPRGWLGPAFTSTMNTIELLAELDFDYTPGCANDDQPYPLRASAGRIISLPYSSEVNDIPAFVLRHHTAEQFAQSVIDQFDVLYEEGAERPCVMGIGIHGFCGQPFRALHFGRALAHMAARPDVWLATSDEIASWYIGAAGLAA